MSSKKTSAIIDLTGVAPKKVSSKKASTKQASKKSKKTARAERTVIPDEIPDKIKKAFAEWKRGTSLADLCRKLTGGKRNPLWIQFRELAGGEDQLHRLRAKGAGLPRGARRYAPTKDASARKALPKAKKGK